jgi:hypothetical protein
VKAALHPAELKAAIDKVHRAGIPGVFAEVRDGEEVWRGAAGVADVSAGGPVTPDMRHRVGSITKTFTAAAVLQQVERGQIGLDAPIGHYLPQLVPGERGELPAVCVSVPQGVPVAGEHHAEELGRQPVHTLSPGRADRDGSGSPAPLRSSASLGTSLSAPACTRPSFRQARRSAGRIRTCTRHGSA